jgi:hypothetical protein
MFDADRGGQLAVEGDVAHTTGSPQTTIPSGLGLTNVHASPKCGEDAPLLPDLVDGSGPACPWGPRTASGQRGPGRIH